MIQIQRYTLVNKRWLIWVGLVSASILGMLIIYFSTPFGVGQINDSVAYISGARSIATGTGYSKLWLEGGEQNPITAYPPLTSIALASLVRFGIDPFDGFRLINIIFFGGAIFLTGIICSSLTGKSWMGFLAATLFATNQILISLYSYAISETLYIFLMFLSIELFYLWCCKKENRRAIILGVILGLATLTRNAGLSLFLTFTICLLLLAEKPFKPIATLAMGYLLVMTPWVIRNWGSEYLMNSPHTLDTGLIQQGGRNLVNWFFVSTNGVFRLTLATSIELSLYFLLIIGVLAARKDKSTRNFLGNPLILFAILHFFFYTGTLAYSINYVEESIGLSDRILSPIYISLFLGFVWTWAQAWHGNNFIRTSFCILLAIHIIINVREARITVGQLSDDGQGYSSLRFRTSPIANAVKALEPDVVIFTNSPPALYSASEGRRSSKGFGLFDDTDPIALMGYFTAVAQEHDFVLVCYGCTQKDSIILQPITDSMDLIAKYGRDIMYYSHSVQR